MESPCLVEIACPSMSQLEHGTNQADRSTGIQQIPKTWCVSTTALYSFQGFAFLSLPFHSKCSWLLVTHTDGCWSHIQLVAGLITHFLSRSGPHRGLSSGQKLFHLCPQLLHVWIQRERQFQRKQVNLQFTGARHPRYV